MPKPKKARKLHGAARRVVEEIRKIGESQAAFEKRLAKLEAGKKPGKKPEKEGKTYGLLDEVGRLLTGGSAGEEEE